MILQTGYLYDDIEGNRHMHGFVCDNEHDIGRAITLPYDDAVDFLLTIPDFDMEEFVKLNNQKIRKTCLLEIFNIEEILRLGFDLPVPPIEHDK